MLFSIVTPSFRQLDWLKRCVRSVADQSVEHEHIVQDAGTGPQLDEWVSASSPARLFVERDKGMYDAVNRGFARASGEIFAYLNCDEQYLPGALAAVAEIFARRPEIDLLAADYLIVDPTGNLRSYHRATPLRRSMILTDHLYDYSCALFYRRRLWNAAGGFRPELRDAGDAEWVCRALAAGARTACLNRYTSTFSLTGGNMSLGDNARDERLKLRAQNPGWMQMAAPLLREYRHVEKLLRGGYSSGPIQYDLYREPDDHQRTRFVCEKPSSRHPFVADAASQSPV
jgi:glycosyltransferase involved in cell wall biosynthesis